ncbi:MAG: S41 family peptidase [Saprospiraceae bacterium]
MKMKRNLSQILKISAVALVGFVGVAAVNTDHGKYFEISKNIEIFTNLYKEINTYYVDDIDPARLMRTGVDAMLESLDPYTNYISESEIEGFRYITEGKYNGIGARMSKVGDYVTITESFEGCPAQKAGLKVGDVVISIDGKSAKGKTTDDVSDILKGFPGTEVAMTVQRPGTKKPLKITMLREEVKVPNVPFSGMVSDKVGYVSLSTFTRNAGKNVGDALKKLKAAHPEMEGVIFDLRGNGGGLLTEAVNVSNVFIPKGEMVVTTKGKVADWDRSFKTLNKPVDQEIPLVVLIDKGSASASEIVSGVLQDLDRGVLIGQRSYGKGLVQNTRDVGYNSRVKLTTAKYYIPSGRCIQGVKYKDGAPLDIPDNERTPFKTRNGRTVMDGGGVKPDMALEKMTDLSVIKNLVKKRLIFDYVTQYTLTHPTIPAVKDFTFTDFNGFLQFLEEKNYHYETDSERLLESLKTKSTEEKYFTNIKSELAAIENKILSEKKNDLTKYKSTIVDLIEKDIASRYYYQKGKIQVALKNDQEIKEAISVLGDDSKYNSFLKK